MRYNVVHGQGLEISHIQHIHKAQHTHTAHTYTRHTRHSTRTIPLKRKTANGADRTNRNHFPLKRKNIHKSHVWRFFAEPLTVPSLPTMVSGALHGAQRGGVSLVAPCPTVRQSLAEVRETEAPRTQENPRGGAVGMPLGKTARPSASARSVTVHESLRNDDSGVIFLSFSYLS